MLFLAAVGESCVVAGDDELKRPGQCLPPLASLDGTGSRMVDPDRTAFEPRLEVCRIFAEIMEQTGDVPPLAGAELGGAGVGEVGDLVQVLTQGLPTGAVAPAGGMGEIEALSLQGYQPFSDNASNLAKL